MLLRFFALNSAQLKIKIENWAYIYLGDGQVPLRGRVSLALKSASCLAPSFICCKQRRLWENSVQRAACVQLRAMQEEQESERENLSACYFVRYFC